MAEKWSRIEVWIGPHEFGLNADDAAVFDAMFEAIADIAHTAKLPAGADPHVSAAVNQPPPDWAIE